MMASPLAQALQVASDGASLTASHGAGTGMESSDFATLLAALGKGRPASTRTKTATAARGEVAEKKAQATGKNTAETVVAENKATASEKRRPATRKEEKERETRVAGATATPVQQHKAEEAAVPAVSTSAVAALPAGIEGLVQAMLGGVSGGQGTDKEGSEGSASRGVSLRVGQEQAPVVAVPVDGATAASVLEAAVAANVTATASAQTGATAPVQAARAQVVLQGLAEGVNPGVRAGWTELSTVPGPAGDVTETAPLADLGSEAPTGVQTTARPGARVSSPAQAGRAAGPVAQSAPAAGAGQATGTDTLWLFRGDPTQVPTVSGATADEVVLGAEAPSSLVLGGVGEGAGKTEKAEKTERGNLERPRSTENLKAPVATADINAEAVVSTPSSDGASTSPVVDASVASAVPGQVGREVTKWLRGQVRPLPEGGSLLELRLKPESLGSITIRMAEQNGQVSAVITVADSHVGQAMVREMPRMAEEMAQQGISLSSVSVGTSGTGQDPSGGYTPQSQQGAAAFRSGRRDVGFDAAGFDSVTTGPVSTVPGGGLINVRA